MKVPTGAFVARRNGQVFVTGNSGFPKHGSKLKPAYEPICVARKGKVSLLNIDAARIETTDNLSHDGGGIQRLNKDLQAQGYRPSDYAKPKEERESPAGRWPANICMDGGYEGSAAAMLDEQSGTLTSGSGNRKPNGYQSNGIYGDFGASNKAWDADSGGASRFFYCAKSSRAERDGSAHPTMKPLALMRWLVRLATFPGELVLDPFAGSGTTLIACQREGRPYIGIDISEEYCAIARKRTAQKGLDLQ